MAGVVKCTRKCFFKGRLYKPGETYHLQMGEKAGEKALKFFEDPKKIKPGKILTPKEEQDHAAAAVGHSPSGVNDDILD